MVLDKPGALLYYKNKFTAGGIVSKFTETRFGF
jgi:hypothetical protein